MSTNPRSRAWVEIRAAAVRENLRRVRDAAGEQAAILNQIMDDIYWKGKIDTERVKEFLGHTPIQVFIGAIIGSLLAVIFYDLWIRA